MSNRIDFQMLVDIEVNNVGGLLEGLILPPALRGRLRKRCTNLKLFDSERRGYLVFVDPVGNNLCRIGRHQWDRFVGDNITPLTKTLCFRKLKDATFEVICFDIEGLEIHFPPNALGPVVKRCLVRASEVSELRQLTSRHFLRHLNYVVPLQDGVVYAGRPPRETLRVVGYKQLGDVSVSYEWEEESHTWVAVGFEGTEWRLICVENHVLSDSTLMFSRFGTTVLLDVFNNADVGLGVAREEDVGSDPVEWLNDREDVDDDVTDGFVLHKCRVKQHDHSFERPQCYSQLTAATLSNRILNMKMWFSRDNNLKSYHRAVIHVGDSVYDGTVRTKRHKKVSGVQDHVTIKADWYEVAEELGLLEGHRFRLQINLEECIPGDLLDIDVC